VPKTTVFYTGAGVAEELGQVAVVGQQQVHSEGWVGVRPQRVGCAPAVVTLPSGSYPANGSTTPASSSAVDFLVVVPAANSLRGRCVSARSVSARSSASSAYRSAMTSLTASGALETILPSGFR
jgi:hypothetical protein